MMREAAIISGPAQIRRDADQQIELAALRRCLDTERVRRQRSAIRLDDLLNAVSVPILLLDGERIVIEANETARRLYGDDMIGMYWDAQPSAAERPTVDGIWVTVDLTAARDARLQLLDASQAALAHQIRTPLTVAGLSLEQAQRTTVDDDVQFKLARVQRSLVDIEHHIRNALVFVRGELAEHAIFSLTELATALEVTWQPLLGDANHWLVRDVPTSARVSGDRAALVSALTNLVENSRAIGGSSTRVRVFMTTTDSEAVLTIADDGPGMSEAMLRRAKEPFVTGRAGGTGLGLPIADAVVRAHGGTLTLASTPQVGTTATIRLPLVSDRTV
jgi:two-component system sensor histidine kinase FlrB